VENTSIEIVVGSIRGKDNNLTITNYVAAIQVSVFPSKIIIPCIWISPSIRTRYPSFSALGSET